MHIHSYDCYKDHKDLETKYYANFKEKVMRKVSWRDNSITQILTCNARGIPWLRDSVCKRSDY